MILQLTKGLYHRVINKRSKITALEIWHRHCRWSGVPRIEYNELWGFHGCAPQVHSRVGVADVVTLDQKKAEWIYPFCYFLFQMPGLNLTLIKSAEHKA